MEINASTADYEIYPLYQQVLGYQFISQVVNEIAQEILGEKKEESQKYKNLAYGVVTFIPLVGTIFNLFLYYVLFKNPPPETPVVREEPIILVTPAALPVAEPATPTPTPIPEPTTPVATPVAEPTTPTPTPVAEPATPETPAVEAKPKKKPQFPKAVSQLFGKKIKKEQPIEIKL